MAKKPFTIEPHTSVDKHFMIEGPDIVMKVDYDDVDHKTVDKMSKRIVKILNSENWE